MRRAWKAPWPRPSTGWAGSRRGLQQCRVGRHGHPRAIHRRGPATHLRRERVRHPTTDAGRAAPSARAGQGHHPAHLQLHRSHDHAVDELDSASKYALESLAEGYRYELAAFGIESCIIEPGGMPTAFLDDMLRLNDPERAATYGDMAMVPEAALKGYVEFLNTIPAQRPQLVADAVVALLDLPYGKKPFRTVVDESGLKQPVEGYNKQYHELTQGIFTAFGWGDMLSLNVN